MPIDVLCKAPTQIMCFLVPSSYLQSIHVRLGVTVHIGKASLSRHTMTSQSPIDFLIKEQVMMSNQCDVMIW